MESDNSDPPDGCHMRVPASTTFALVALIATCSCAQLAPSSDTYASVFSPLPRDDASAEGSPAQTAVVPGNWDCLATPLAMPSSSPATVTYVVPIVDFATPPSALISTTPAIQGLAIQACGTFDPNCVHPYKSMPAAVNLPFVYAIPMPTGTDSLLSITAPNYIPTLYYFLGPLVGSQDGGATVQGAAIATLTSDTAAYLEGGGHVTLDATKGILALRTVDCLGQRAAGVSVRMGAQSETAAGGNGFTLINNLPDFADPPKATDTRGVAGFVNVTAPYNVEVSGVLADGRVVNEVVVGVYPNTFSLADIRPPSVVPQ